MAPNANFNLSPMLHDARRRIGSWSISDLQWFAFPQQFDNKRVEGKSELQVVVIKSTYVNSACVYIDGSFAYKVKNAGKKFYKALSQFKMPSIIDRDKVEEKEPKR